MNRFVVAAVAASALIAPFPALAQERPPESGETRTEERRDPPRESARPQHRAALQAMPGQYRAEVRQPHAWSPGERFDRHRAPHYARIVHLDHYGLAPPPPGHVWVRSGSDALLVRLTNNIVVSIRPEVFG